jgi:phosphoglycolate phosphatase
MEEAGVSAAGTVIVGDSEVDVRTGRNAGALTAGVTYGFDREGLRRVPPDLLLDRLEDLEPRLRERDAAGDVA